MPVAEDAATDAIEADAGIDAQTDAAQPEDVTAVEVVDDVAPDVLVDAQPDVAPDVQPDVVVDPCVGMNCDDGNACTTDTCVDGACQWAQVPDWTACGEAMVCDGQGMCADVKIAKGMAYIPAGTFWMGCNAVKDSNCFIFVNESPQHKVNLAGYYVDLTEVTVAAYTACVNAGVCTEPGEQSPKQYATYPGFPNNPVNNITWTQARKYCAWRGAGFDLPTEAQWEMAARGSCEKNGSSAAAPTCAAAMRTYPWGEDAPSGSYVVASLTSTAAVGSVPGGDSPYGLHDMAGNLYEFTRDLLDTSFYSVSPTSDPLNSTLGSFQTIRGGAIGNNQLPLRSSSRDGFSAFQFAFNLGFRCMRTYP